MLRTNMWHSVSDLINEVKINKNSKPKKWFDLELKAFKEKKIIKYNNWSTDKCEINWNEYILTRNEYNKLIKAKKSEFTRKEIISA